MRPPQHKPSHPYVILDSATKYWDNKRVADECERLEEELERVEDPPSYDELSRDHPVLAYRQGRTRFDLDAPGTVYTVESADDDPERGVIVSEQRTARDYLTGEPPAFHCVRLKPDQVATCVQLGSELGAITALQIACKEAPGLKVGKRKMVSDGQMAALQDRLGYDVLARVGKMLVAASRGPTAAEKKHSGSSPGSA